MPEEQPPKAPAPKAATSEADNINRFAEHVKERKRRKNLWGHYADDQSRAKGDWPTVIGTPMPSEPSEKEKEVKNVPEMTKLQRNYNDSRATYHAHNAVKFDGKDGQNDKAKQEEEDVDKAGFVKTPCFGGLPKENDNTDLYEL